ncbi:MAG: DUF4838 domain-containing protein [Clostridia bacterium]|nr:DUF4838 domain-containing protein [Clostridia bacterium]
MKKIGLILALLVVFTCVLPVFSSAAKLTEGGYIVLPEKPDERLSAAADTLSRYLGEITDKEFPQAADGTGIKFVIDYSDEAADNGYIIETAENEVSIKGNGTRGVIHGVYAFLEKYAGCDWYTSTLYSIPKNEELVIPAGEKTEYEPFFEYTDTDWVSPRDVEYSLANGLNGSPYRTIPSELGGTVEYISDFCHTLASQFCSKATYFESNPEYFALHDGKRQDEQLCLTNEDVYNLILGEVMALLKEKHDPEKSLQIISLTQGDSGEDAKMCQCDNCKAIDDENGSHSGTMINFVNRIAREVKAAGYDNVAIDTFAYRYTRKAPSKVVPEDNVIVRLCTIECCFSHALDDSTCTENVALMNDLSDWSKICDRIYVWDYATNYAHTLGIFPDFGVLQRNVQVFYENNVVGVYEEGNYYMASCDGEFGELRSFLLSKLMQNPYMDYDAYMNEFLEAYYGNGWENIRQFIDMTIEKPTPEGEHLRIYVSMPETLGFDKKDIEKADLLWENAKAQAENETFLQRTQRSEICWRYWKAYNKYDKKEAEKLIADIKDFGITMVQEGDTIGPDKINFAADRFKSLGNDVLFPASIVFYGIAAVLSVIVMIIAIKNKKYVYIALPVLIGVFFEIFGWHRRAFLAWTDMFGYAITLILIFFLFAFGGALMVRGKKQRIISALVCSFGWFILYEASTLILNNLIFGGSANALGIGAAYLITGIEAVIILIIMLKNIVKESKK